MTSTMDFCPVTLTLIESAFFSAVPLVLLNGARIPCSVNRWLYAFWMPSESKLPGQGSFLRMQARQTHLRCSSFWMSYPNGQAQEPVSLLRSESAQPRKWCRSVTSCSSSSEGVPVGLERGVGVEGVREGVREGVGDGVGWGVIKQESDEAILNKSWQSCQNRVEIRQSVTTKCYE